MSDEKEVKFNLKSLNIFFFSQRRNSNEEKPILSYPWNLIILYTHYIYIKKYAQQFVLLFH